jgi:hypothetical protein
MIFSFHVLLLFDSLLSSNAAYPASLRRPKAELNPGKPSTDEFPVLPTVADPDELLLDD